jgi:hypothetical protein
MESIRMSITLRHAAALALVGWYLMVPPLVEPDKRAVDHQAPLGAWLMMKSFDSASGCQRTMEAMQSAPPKPETHIEGLTEDQRRTAAKVAKDWMDSMLCVSTDDPRLKEK